jgi:hypothetical protein
MSAEQNTIAPEEWRDVTPEVAEGYPVAEGYQISNAGRLRSRRRCGPHQHCGLRKKWRVLKGVVNQDGYIRYNLVNADGSCRIWQGHRLVALAFIGSPPADKPLVCHRDGNPANNLVSNLLWGDFDDNTADAVRHGTQPRGEAHGMTTLNADQVREVVRLYDAGESRKSLGARFGVTSATISNILRGITWASVTGFYPGHPGAPNDADRLARRPRGESAVNAIMTASSVLEIVRLCQSGVSQADAAKRFGVAATTVGGIIHGRKWSSVTGIVAKSRPTG